MKHILLFILLLLVSYNTNAQYSYVPMPTDSAQWRCRQYIGVSGGYFDTYDQLIYTTGADTVLMGITYKKVFLRGHYISHITTLTTGKPAYEPVTADAPDCFLGGMREAGKLVYFRGVRPQFNNCYFDTTEFQFYNFNLNAGDSLNNALVGSGMLIGSKIAYIDTVMIGTNLRKRYHTVNDTTIYADYIIEGIGSIRGLQPYPSAYANDNDLLCFTQNGNVLYSISAAACSAYIFPFGTEVANVARNTGVFKVYPNPVSNGNFKIEVPANAASAEIVLYDLYGKIMKELTTNNNHTINIDCSGIAKGIYLLKATTEGSTYRERVVIW